MIGIEYSKDNVKTVSIAEQDNTCLPFETVKIKMEPRDFTDEENSVQRSVDCTNNVRDEPQENEPSLINIKLEPTRTILRHLIYCCYCKQEFEDYCPNCTSVSHILNNVGSRTRNRLKTSIPKNILEIINPPFREPGVFALRTIRKGVTFGPYEGLECSILSAKGNAWKMSGEKLKTKEELEYVNWMSCVNSTEDTRARNLFAFQHDGRVYYQSNRQINRGNELLIHYDRNCFHLDGVDQYYCPVRAVKMDKIHRCVHCCLGFSVADDLVKHKTGCPHEKHKMECRFGEIKNSPCTLPFGITNLRSFKKFCRETEHLNVHTVVRPYICNLCGKKFPAVSNLYKHIKNHVSTNGKLTEQQTFFKGGVKKCLKSLHSKDKSHDCDV